MLTTLGEESPESRQAFEVAASRTSGRGSQPCFLSSNWFFECYHRLLKQLSRAITELNGAHYIKRTAIRPWLEIISYQQDAAHAQQRSYAIHAARSRAAESFSS